jgi:hypothetical protein
MTTTTWKNAKGMERFFTSILTYMGVGYGTNKTLSHTCLGLQQSPGTQKTTGLLSLIFDVTPLALKAELA